MIPTDKELLAMVHGEAKARVAFASIIDTLISELSPRPKLDEFLRGFAKIPLAPNWFRLKAWSLFTMAREKKSMAPVSWVAYPERFHVNAHQATFDECLPILPRINAILKKNPDCHTWDSLTRDDLALPHLCHDNKFSAELDFEYQMATLALETNARPVAPTNGEIGAKGKTKQKTRIPRGGSIYLFVSGLQKHHGYENGRCAVYTPTGPRELHGKTGINPGTATRLFKKHFQGHPNYVNECADRYRLERSLKRLVDDNPLPRQCSSPDAFPDPKTLRNHPNAANGDDD